MTIRESARRLASLETVAASRSPFWTVEYPGTVSQKIILDCHRPMHPAARHGNSSTLECSLASRDLCSAMTLVQSRKVEHSRKGKQCIQNCWWAWAGWVKWSTKLRSLILYTYAYNCTIMIQAQHIQSATARRRSRMSLSLSQATPWPVAGDRSR